MKIAAGEWALTAAPESGGAIRSLTRAGKDILRPTVAGAIEPLDCACFPLVPYANRIADGAFEWGGETIRLPRNHPAQAHPLHGTGWLTPWSVAAADETSLVMRLTHEGDEAWPWAFCAEQRLSLSAHGLSATLEVVNDADRAMPVSLGFHPYFPSAETLRFEADSVWMTDEAFLPTRHAEADTLGDWSDGAPLARADLIDHCYTGWSGTATLGRADGDIVLEADGAPALHVFIPPGENFFCAEPVSAMPDAVNRGAAASLEPGQNMAIAMRIRSA